MNKHSSIKAENRNYNEIMEKHSDAELLRVLKKRNLYEALAAEAAIREAIRRGLIQSEIDLQSDKFNDKPESYQWFPKIENERARLKTMKSVARSLLILTALPIIAGGSLLSKGNNIESAILLIFGAAWGFVAWQLLQLVREKLIYLMGFFTFIACSWQIWTWLETPAQAFIDYFVLVVLTGFIAYGLVFLHRLNRIQPD